MKKKSENGFTLIELLVVAAIIGILLAIAVPNLIKARISANEANARKAMQSLRDAEAEFSEQDIDDAGGRDFTSSIGDSSTPGTLRYPFLAGAFDEEDSLIDDTFEGADLGTTDGAGDASTCVENKAGYCVTGDFTNATQASTGNANGGWGDFGWEASPVSINKTGRKDFSVYGDGVLRCVLSSGSTGDPGTFAAERNSGGCN